MNAAPACLPPGGACCRRRTTWFLFIALLVFHLCFQAMHGAWTSDLGGDPDEAAHAVTSLMLRDYLAGGWQQSPLTFAQNYYAAFPKVALGHYPPGFYLLAGVWLLPCASITSLFVLQAVLAAVFGALTYRVAARLLPVAAALAAGMLTAVLPFTLKQTELVMADFMLSALCLVATMAWSDYLCRPTNRRALAFGLLAALAILTKGSALALCLVPPVTTLLCRRWLLLKQLSWWLSALPVVLLAGPWMVYSTRITAEGMVKQSVGDYALEAARYYALTFPDVLGWPLLACVMLGLGLMLRSCCRAAAPAPLAASLIGLLVGTMAISLFVPAGYSARYLLPMLPTLLIAAVIAADTLAARLRQGRWIAFAVIILAAVGGTAAWPVKQVTGYTAAVQRVGVPAMAAQPTAWLVASDPRGEGAIIAAAAFGSQSRVPATLRVLRGSKELSTSDWMGRGYVLAFQTVPDLLAHLDSLKVRHVFVDMAVPEEKRLPHHQLLLSAMQSGDQRWQLAFEEPVQRGPAKLGGLRVYERAVGGRGVGKTSKPRINPLAVATRQTV